MTVDALATAVSPVVAFGSFSLAASADQPGMRYIGEKTAVIAATELRFRGHRRVLCLGDPLAPREEWSGIARRVLNSARDAVFLNVGEEFAQILAREGLFVEGLGWEAILDLQAYDLAGPKKQNIRNAIRRAAAAGLVVEEVLVDVDEDWLALDAVSQDWLRRRGGRRPENRLITRPFLRRNRFQRVFALRDEKGVPIHFVTVDEMWEGGEVVGYHSNINRGLERSPKNADYAIHGHIIDVLRAEGVRSLSLGLCPELGVRRFGKKGNVYTALALDTAERFGSRLYNLHGITAHKAEFRPTVRRHVYLATRNPWPADDLLAVCRASNLL